MSELISKYFSTWRHLGKLNEESANLWALGHLLIVPFIYYTAPAVVNYFIKGG